MTNFLGIDLGTSSVKAVLVDKRGNALGKGHSEYPIHAPQTGRAEQDPRDWWRGTALAVREATSKQGDVGAIGICGQMHGLVLLDELGEVLHPAVIWPDQRSKKQVEEITRLVGAEKLISVTGSPAATGFQAATIRWFQGRANEIWKRVKRILLPKDYLRWQMTGVFASDPSDGSGTLLLDGQRRDWSSLILEILEIDPDLLPPLQASITQAGELTPGAAVELGLKPGIPVITGAADTASSLLGAGVTDPADLLVNISTGGQLITPAQQFAVDEFGRTHTFCSALEPTSRQAGWYKMGATLSAGGSLRWLRENVFGLIGEDAYDQMTALAEQVQPGSGGLIFLPYLVGERTPLMDPDARGAMIGLTLKHSQGEMVRAVMEGVTFSLYEAYQALISSNDQPKRVILSGGGARSTLWQRIVADVFGFPVQRLQTSEASALGAALLGCASLGSFEVGQTSRSWAKYDPPIDPSNANTDRYQALLESFRQLYLNTRGYLFPTQEHSQ